MKLYEISENMMKLQMMVEDGELEQDQVKDTLDMLDESFESKAEGIIRLIRNQEAQEKALKDESKRLADKAKRLKTNNEWLNDYLKIHMQVSGKDKLDLGIFTLAIRNNPPSVEVGDDLSKVPEAYLKPQPPKPDKTAIKKAWLDGEEVPGTKLITDKTSLKIK